MQMQIGVEWGTVVKTNAIGGADAQLGEKQWMWRHLHPEIATTSFQMRHSQGSVDVAVITELCISAAYRISSLLERVFPLEPCSFQERLVFLHSVPYNVPKITWQKPR
jgi:hypothetical protein